MLLSLTQQIILVPVFLHYWSVDTLGAWFAIMAAGNLVLVADAGIHAWSLNRFLSFKSSDDCDRQTGSYYGTGLRLYLWLAAAFAVLILLAAQFIHPSIALRFSNQPDFDIAFLAMTVGAVLALPANLTVALYRARGLYGRVVGIQCWTMVIAQLGQLVGIKLTGSLLVVVAAYVAGQIVYAIYIMAFDARRQLPVLRDLPQVKLSWPWTISQLRGAFPFGVMNITELVLAYAPVLLVSAFVTDRVLVAQWALVRTIASLLKGLCLQMTLPLAAELGHDYVTGMKEQLRSLYARGSLLLTLFASVVTSGAIVFWSDFFAIWTHGTIPDNPVLMMTLLIGTCVGAPSVLALSYANYSNRGYLLLWTKSLQLLIFLLLSLILIPRLGPMGAAIAVISSDIAVQSGILSTFMMRETLQHPIRHVAILIGVMVTVVPAGAAMGEALRYLLPGAGVAHFVVVCALWLAAIAVLASPLTNKPIRTRLVEAASHSA
jgi:O-antigen/teichoic acid export membrane protein